MKAKIDIDCGKVTGKVSPHIYGHFIEHLGRCIYGGIWAEMLVNRKFFSLYCDPPHRWADSKEEGVVDPWFSIGRNGNTCFDHDNTVFYSGNQSQRIEIRKADGQEHGVGQGELATQKNREYAGRIVVKCQRVNVSTCQRKNTKKGQRSSRIIIAGSSGQNVVDDPANCKFQISLRNKENKVLDEKEIKLKNGGWETYKFKLKANADCGDARLCLTTKDEGTIWFGAVSLMPADNIKGMRKDTLEVIKQINPPIIRWPGGNFVSGYHWKDGIGDQDRRSTTWDYAWNAPEYNDFGTDEYLQFCREVKCDPLVCINAGSLATIKEAADWVKYCKGKVKYWDIGNEQYGNWQLGHMDAETFAQRTLKFIKAMRKVDPKIKVVGCGVMNDWSNHWNEPLLRIAGKELDYLSVHDYTSSNSKDRDYLYNFIVGAPTRIEKLLVETTAYVNRLSPGRKIPLAFDEWNVWLPEANIGTGLEMPYRLRDGIYAAGVFNAMIRLSDDVKMGNLAQLVNVLGTIYTDRTKVFANPLHTAFRLYTGHTGEEAVEVKTVSPAFDVASVDGAPEYKSVPYIDCSVTLQKSNCKLQIANLYIAIINRHPKEEAECEISIKDLKTSAKAAARQMRADDFDSKEAEIAEFQVEASPSFIFKAPAHSVTIIEAK